MTVRELRDLLNAMEEFDLDAEVRIVSIGHKRPSFNRPVAYTSGPSPAVGFNLVSEERPRPRPRPSAVEEHDWGPDGLDAHCRTCGADAEDTVAGGPCTGAP